MIDDLGWVDLGVRPDAGGFGTSLSTQIGPGLDQVGRQAGSRFSVGFKRAAVAGAAGLATAGAFALKLGVDSIAAASDLEESTNKVSEVFGKAADSVFRFSSKAADALGQTNEQARSAAATFGIFGKAADLNDRQAAKFSKRMVKLASDLASFNNTEPDQAVEALGAALRGEAEPIRAYGVLLDEATLKAEALALGILQPVKNKSQIMAYQVAVTEGQKKYNEAVDEHGKKSLEALKAEAGLGTARDRLKKATEGTIPPLTQQQKLLAAQSQIFKQTSVAQGDFARTSDGLANQQRRMAARFEDTKAKLGKGLLPIMNDAAGFILDEGIPAFERFADWFNKDGIPAIKTFGGFVSDAAGHTKDLIGFLNDLPDPAKYAGLIALAGGVAAGKVRGGGGGVLGTVGKVIGVTKPVPVFVTNPGFGLPGGSPKTPPILPAGLPGAAPKVFGTLPKYAKFGAIAGLGSAPGQDSLMKQLFGFGLGGSGDAPKLGSDAQKNLAFADPAKIEANNQALRDFYLTGDLATKSAKRLGIETNANVGKFEAFYRESGDAKTGVDRLRRSVDLLALTKVRPTVDTSSIERALGLIAQLTDGMHGVPTAGSDGGAPFLSGAGQRAGVNNTFTGPIYATDTKDITRQADKSQRMRSRGGRG